MAFAPREHLDAELQRLDLLLHREILRLRASYQLSLDEFRGLYVSDEQVDALVRRGAESGPGHPAAEELTLRAAELRGRIDSVLDPHLPWWRVAREFQLGPAERDALLIALAPEFDRKYETLYAYLNNDVTRRWPTVDLVRRLSDAAEPVAPDSGLFASGLLQPFPPAAERASWPATGLRASPVLAPYVLEKPALDPLLAEFCRVENPAAGWEGNALPPENCSLQRIPPSWRSSGGADPGGGARPKRSAPMRGCRSWRSIRRRPQPGPAAGRRRPCRPACRDAGSTFKTQGAFSTARGIRFRKARPSCGPSPPPEGR
jgi:hypothetical protein